MGISSLQALKRLKQANFAVKLLCFICAATVSVLFFHSPKQNLLFSGTVELNEYYLGAPIAGRIKEIYVSEGDKVHQGQRLVELERYDQAYRDFTRAKALFEDQVISEQEFEHATLALQEQQVSSPVQGIVLQKLYDKAEVAPAGARLLVIADTKEYWVKIFIPQSMINTLSIGQPANIWLEGLKEAYTGHIGYISPLAEFTPRAVQTASERANQTFAVKVYFDEIPSSLRPGVSADVAFKDV